MREELGMTRNFKAVLPAETGSHVKIKEGVP